MQRIVVVLPAPFGPRKPVTLPGSMPNVKSSTATLSPYRFVSPRTSIMETGPLRNLLEKSSRLGEESRFPAVFILSPAGCHRIVRGDDYAILLQDEPLASVPTPLAGRLVSPDKDLIMGSSADGTHMIVLPGGGYAAHAPHEAEPVASWLGEIGMRASVFRYPLNGRHPA